MRTAVEEVVVDIVARDKKGRTVRNLRPDEIRVYEDGKLQSIRGFRFAGGPPAASSGQPVAASGQPVAASGQPAAAPRGPRGAGSGRALSHLNMVTLVFDRLSTEGRILARQGALDFLDKELNENVYVAVFALDDAVYALQEFTRDHAEARAAVEKATGGYYSIFPGEKQKVKRRVEEAVRAFEARPSLVAPTGEDATTSAAGSAYGEQQAALMSQEMLKHAARMEARRESRASLFGLLTIIQNQTRVAGRKTLIYFSQGLRVPSNMVAYYRDLVSTANRNNVSVYTVDARGLMSQRPSGAEAGALADAAATSADQVTRLDGTVSLSDVMLSEDVESVIRMNVQETLATMAEETAGFAVANTNDLRTGMRRVADDIRGHYELTYRPPRGVYDGKFRSIKVEVLRPGVNLQARSGYFALPPASPDAPPVLSYEMQMLGALSSDPLPHDLAYTSQALRFGSQAEGVDHAVVIQAPLGAFAVEQDGKAGLFRKNFSVLALVKDADGQMVRKVSQSYPLTGQLQNLSSVNTGMFLFWRNLRLPPGRYTLETAVHDRISGKAGASRTALVVTPGKGISISSLMLIRRADPLKPDNDPDDPFAFENVHIVPNLGEGLAAGSKGVPLFLVVYPANENGEQPELTLECLKDGQLVAKSAVPLGQPDAKGRIALAGDIPLPLAPGQYQLHAVVKQGTWVAEENLLFAVKPQD